MNLILVIGNIAAFLTTASFLPQAVKVIRTRNTTAISLPMYLMFISGIICWLTYGIGINDRPIIMANSITLIFSSIILFFKLKDEFSKKTN